MHSDRDAVRRSQRFLPFAAAVCLATLARPANAQSLLYAQNGDHFSLVRRALGDRSFVLDNGTLVAADQGQFVLKPVDEYLPVLISVNNFYLHRGPRAISDKGPAEAYLYKAGRLVFQADLEAPCDLDDVVLAITLENDKGGGNELRLFGIGRLDARKVRHISLDDKTQNRLLEDRLRIHLFVGGKEAINSRLSAHRQDQAWNRIVAARVAALTNAEARPLYGPAPDYPPGPKPAVRGRAVVTFRIDRHGRVVDPAVTSATAPAFGPAALDAVKQWRFIPKVKDGAPVESTASLPFVFAPPS